MADEKSQNTETTDAKNSADDVAKTAKAPAAVETPTTEPATESTADAAPEATADNATSEAPKAEKSAAKEPKLKGGEIIRFLNKKQMKSDVPDFAPGDTIIVQVKVIEGTRERLQAFEGVVIAKSNRGLNSSFIVRKIASGVGIERTFQTHSPLIAGIKVKRRADVRRAKLYYLRNLSGKAARIKEKV